MPTVEAMTLEEIEATMAALRARRKTLKAMSTVNQRKIVTLARRRERLMQQVNSLDEEISQLRGKPVAPPPPVADQRRTRRRPSEPTTGDDAILVCVKRHGSTKRATILNECQLTPAAASAALRQLCQAGKLVRHGEKNATTYSLP